MKATQLNSCIQLFSPPKVMLPCYVFVLVYSLTFAPRAVEIDGKDDDTCLVTDQSTSVESKFKFVPVRFRLSLPVASRAVEIGVKDDGTGTLTDQSSSVEAKLQVDPVPPSPKGVVALICLCTRLLTHVCVSRFRDRCGASTRQKTLLLRELRHRESDCCSLFT